MFINQLPDDCLLIIFSSINELDDLLNCYKVCSKWSHLIAERTRKVKYLNILIGGTMDHLQIIHSIMFIIEQRNQWMELIGEFSHGFHKKVKHEEIVSLVKNIKSCKGLIHQFYQGNESIFQYCDQLEMVSTDYIEPWIKKNGVNIKQLHLLGTLESFKEDAHYFPNLERLYIHDDGGQNCIYDGPIFRRLKIIELALSSLDDVDGVVGPDVYYGFNFIDYCPNLQSAHFKVDSDVTLVDESVKHKSLQDLVLHFDSGFDEWYQLKFGLISLFLKCPNLKHLAMRKCYPLENAHVKHLVGILPNLVLLDVRGSPKVTREAADYIQDYNKLHGRSIKFYFKDNHQKISSDWPQLSTEWGKISQGFDFMKHCFLKDFPSLSTFLIPCEDL
uniref:F-box domain-containing protein n=1 Tax=Tetranychus urticae TaxID=32264 RepID=T1JU64_TETUR